jgi:hypothetical protein
MRASRTRTFTTANAAATTNNLANRFLIPLLNSRAGGLLGHRLAVVEYAGRRTGQDHELVAMYVAEGHTVRFTVGMAEHKTWWRNFETPIHFGCASPASSTTRPRTWCSRRSSECRGRADTARGPGG